MRKMGRQQVAEILAGFEAIGRTGRTGVAHRDVKEAVGGQIAGRNRLWPSLDVGHSRMIFLAIPGRGRRWLALCHREAGNALPGP